jgi:hypothetical protein
MSKSVAEMFDQINIGILLMANDLVNNFGFKYKQENELTI